MPTTKSQVAVANNRTHVVSRELKKKQNRVVQQAAFDELLDLKHKNGGELKYGDFKKIIEKYTKQGFFSIVTHRNLSYRLALMQEKGVVSLTTEVRKPCAGYIDTVGNMDDISPLTEAGEEANAEVVRLAVGRKVGTTNKAKEKYLQHFQEATMKAAQLYSSAKTEAYNKGTKLPNGTLAKIIQSTEAEYSIQQGTINKFTVTSRERRNNLSGIAHHKVSPIAAIEPLIVEWCIKMAKIGSALTRSEVIDLATELILGTEHEKAIIVFKKKRQKETDGEPIIGITWYKGFMKRNRNKLKRGRARVSDRNRHTWCTYENFCRMYDGVYECMEEAGVAEKMEEEVMYDVRGNLTENIEEMVGRKTKYNLLHPEYLLFVDETGCNTNQKDDKYAGGELFCLPVEDEGGLVGLTTDIHFSVLCFTSALGEPVLAAVILKSDRDIEDIPLSWKVGLDIRKDIKTGTTVYETIQQNWGKDKSMCGGPQCTYNGKTIPCFVGCSPKASITSEMLAQMLCQLDTLEVFDRSKGIMPVLLLDGHHSRLKLPFLQYINDPEHKWNVCLGVPYGTHLWQVADAAELNGCFKIALNKAKREYVRYKTISNTRFVPSDILPLINTAWEKSFARSNVARKAILRRGWNPLNYVLVDHPKLLRDPTEAPEPKISTTETTTTNTANTADPSTGSSTITDVPNLVSTYCPTTTADNGQSILVVNTSGVTTTRFLDSILLEQQRAAGRKRVCEEEFQQNQDKGNRYEALAKLTGTITSGSLALTNNWYLGPEVLAKIKEKEDSDEQKKQAVENQKDEQKRKESERFRDAYRKYRSMTQRLNVTDLKHLLRKVKQQDDSPLQTKMADLELQWQKRKIRFDDFLCTPVDAETVNTLDMANSGTENEIVPFGSVVEVLEQS